MFASVGLGVLAKSAAADMVWPDSQYPHCTTSSFFQAACTALPVREFKSSMVITRLPETADTGVTQERMGTPSRSTVHAPHTANPQPNFVPVSPKVSRKAQSNGVAGARSSVRVLSFTTSDTALPSFGTSLTLECLALAPRVRMETAQRVPPCNLATRNLEKLRAVDMTHGTTIYASQPACS